MGYRRNSRRVERRFRRWTAGVVPLSILTGAAVIWHSSEAAYRVTTYTGGNSWSSGNVVLATDQTGVAVFGTLTDLNSDASLSSLSPPANGAYSATTTANGGSKCIYVTYSGASTANIRMRVTVTDSGTGSDGGLAQSMLLSVDTGTGATNVNCTSFTSTGYIYGTPANTNKYVTGFPTTYAGGAATEWSNATATTSKWYRISWLLPSNANNTAQQENATITFTWEAQSV